MTTRIPTSKESVDSGDFSGQALPDLDSIATMANAFYRALPGSSSPATAGVSGLQPALDIPAKPQIGLSTDTPAPPPHVESFTTSLPGPGYYFLDHNNPWAQVSQPAAQGERMLPADYGLPNEQYGLLNDKQLAELLNDDARVVNQARAPEAPELQVPTGFDSASADYHRDLPSGSDRIAAQSYHLPGEPDVQRALSVESIFGQRDDASVATGNRPSSSASPKKPGSPDFYFLESGHTPVFGNQPLAAASPVAQGFDIHAIRKDFPILSERVNGRPLIWFDNAATTHKPQSVIDRISYFYQHENSNIHRAAHELAARATDAYEAARNKVARFLGAKSSDEIIFVRGATEAINLLANTWGKQHIGEGDEIIVSLLEHHANIVPWHMLASAVGAKIRVIPVDDSGQILLEEYRKLFNGRTKLVAATQVSNALGTVTPIKDMIDIAHASGVRVMVDGAQAVSHMSVNVQALDADFYVFSGHKVFGPTGIGVIYGKRELLEKMNPWQGGGNMIADVTFDRIIYQDPPNRLEAGTGNIADAVGLGAAIDYVQRIGMDRIARYEHDLLEYAMHGLRTIPGVRLIGTAKDKASVASFVLDGYKTEEVGTELNREGIAVRSGHHCAQPILRRFGVETTVRPSFAFYNTCEEIDLLLNVVDRLSRQRRGR